MNTLIINKNVTITVPGLAPKALVPGERIAPTSPFYWVVLWGGFGNDSGSPDPSGDERVFKPGLVVVGKENPQIGEGGVWIQEFDNGDYTFWIEDGK